VRKTPTEVRQGDPRKTNFRVLIISTLIAFLVLGGFTIAFLMKTPPQMEGVQNKTPEDHPSQGLPPAPKPLP
jgi:hypothetical protein